MVGLILLVFAFVCFTIAAVWNPTPNPNWNRIVAAGLAFFIAAMLFGHLTSQHLIP